MSGGSSSKQPNFVEPALYGGYGKDFSDEATMKQTRAGLVGKVFPTNAPPDVSSKTRIIALLGTVDFEDYADPDSDGWFVSDFYLFHHLFQGVAHDQKWLTCLDPKTLVQKYKEYAHGDPRKERKIVLDDSMLPYVTDVAIFPPENLLERFISVLKDEARIAVAQHQPLLILLMGHGDEDTHGISIGGNPVDMRREDPRYFLHKSDVSNALGFQVDAKILSTACFGGGWAMTPLLNTTTMAGSTADEETLSWPMSASCSRSCGGRFASAVTKLIIQQNLPGSIPLCDVPHPSRGKASGAEEAIESIESYAELLRIVHGIIEDIDSRPNNEITFSAKDDRWEAAWMERSGIPLSIYEEKWNQLRTIPIGDHWPGDDKAGSPQSHTGSLRLGYRIFTENQAARAIRVLAKTYLKSNPGNPSAAKNHMINRCCLDLLQGKKTHLGHKEIYGSLNYRLYKIMGLATAIKNQLGLRFPDCHEVDIDDRISAFTKVRLDNYSQCTSFVIQFRFFDRPGAYEGQGYSKGSHYLGLLLEQSGWTREQAWEKLSLIDVSKLNGAYQTVQALELHKLDTVQRALKSISKLTGKRLRSISPKKHARRSLSG